MKQQRIAVQTGIKDMTSHQSSKNNGGGEQMFMARQYTPPVRKPTSVYVRSNMNKNRKSNKQRTKERITTKLEG